jgi:branched-chain amino acid transport system substrate-binding protein
MSDRTITRRQALKAAGALVGAGAASRLLGPLSIDPALRSAVYAATPSGTPLRIGFQVHRTGIGATYGKWYERTGAAAVAEINGMGGIAGRRVELVAEDDGTDPKRGVEVVEKLAQQHKVDFIFGTLFSHVVIAAAPRAGELKIPYLVVSEGYHVASGKMNRYTFQPGITDVRAQVTALAPWIVKNLGKKITMVYPDYAFGYDHRDFFGKAAEKQGGKIAALVPIPLSESSFTKFFPKIPKDTDAIYHVMVGPGVLTFVKELGDFFGKRKPKMFGFIDSLEGVDFGAPGLEYLEGSHIWEAFPRYATGDDTPSKKAYRQKVGVDANGASKQDAKDVSTYSHMFGVWETLFVIKDAVEKSGYKSPTDYRGFIEAIEKMESMPGSLAHPQGPKRFSGKTHQVYGHQFVSQVSGKKLKVVYRTRIEDGMYPPEADYTKQPL